MDIEGNVRCGIAQRASRSGLAKTALRASTLTALALLIALAVLLPNAAAEAQTSPASTATATATPTDYDSDNDGLIDINTLAQLNAVRHDLNGDGKQGSVSATDWATYTAAFPNSASGMGCKPTDHDDDTTTAKQPTCDGYELMADLDFDTNGDGEVNSSDTNSYANWTPIGTAANPFNAKFKGNSHSNTALGSMASFGVRNAKISNLTISGELTEVGLFGATSATARIEGVGLVDVNVNTTTSARNAKISALVGNNAGRITACSVTGKISAGAGAYPDAGGLVGYNGGTIAAAFSRATVYMTSSSEIYVGGLVGYNGGTITATYSAGAVKGKGGSGVVGGLVGYNVGTINASYSIAPVTSVDVDPTNIRTSKPTVLGLSYNENGFSTVTASYWDSIASGVPDDADRLMPEGKTMAALTAPTNASGIYADWDDLTIGDASDVDPWTFIAEGYPPLLMYRGLTAFSGDGGNQEFASLDISSRYGGNAIHPQEGMTLKTITKWGKRSRGSWIWETSTDGITWTTLVPSPGERSILTGANSHWLFVPRSEHVGKHIRARIQLGGGGYVYTRVTGKIKPAATAAALGFASGHNPPRVGTAIRVSLPPSGVTSATGLWQRCDDNTATPQGCERVGSLHSYTPGAADLGHHLRADIYYKNSAGAWMRASTGFTQQVVDRDRASQWRGDDD